MKGILTSYKINEKYLPVISWGSIICVICIALFRLPLSGKMIGDEEYYVQEVVYLAQYGFYNTLSQATSTLYSVLIYLCSKLFFVDYLIGARILSIIAFLVSCRLLYKCTGRFEGLSMIGRHMALLLFMVVCYGWLWKGLADIVGVPFYLAAFYILTGKASNKDIVIAALLLFCGFAVKPTTLLTVPGLATIILVTRSKERGWVNGFVMSSVFCAIFVFCFVAYHMPAYKLYGTLKLETKDHFYKEGKRIETKNLWYERIVYFEQYNVNHKPNKWQVTWEEIDSFKAANPQVNLSLSYGAYVKKYAASYVQNIGIKLFLMLPYSIQYGFFFAKWTVVNKFIGSIVVIRVLTLLLIASICVVARKFIKDNALLLFAPYSYYLVLSVYVLSQIEENWLLMCLPFLALPIIKVFSERVNIVVFAALQIIYLLL